MPYYKSHDLPDLPLAVIANTLSRVSEQCEQFGSEEKIAEALAKDGIDISEGPESLTLEQGQAAFTAYRNLDIPVSLADINVLMIALSRMIDKLESARAFAKYLRDHGEVKYADYLHNLVVIHTSYDESE